MISKEEQYNQLHPYLVGFIKTWAYNQLLYCPHKVIGIFAGNQALKTSNVAHQYVRRIFGEHPVPKKNVVYFECETRDSITNPIPHGYYWRKDAKGRKLERMWEKGTWQKDNLPKDMKCSYCGAPIRVHKRGNRVFRFAAENLPTESTNQEIKNSVYPEFRKWLPDFLIKRDPHGKPLDITVRRPSITILDPNAGRDFGGVIAPDDDITVEFVSYSQQVQAGAGVQRMSCWEDEESPIDFHEEQLPRLLKEDGDIIKSVTPAEGMSWSYDEIFEKADKYIRTDAVCEYLSTRRKKVKNIEYMNSGHDVAVIQAATDDNPTLSPKVVDDMYNEMADPDGTVIATRRYGIFKQATGRIFKDYNTKIHFIDPKVYGISQGLIDTWLLARGVDYHPSNPWACLWMGLSPQNEAFVIREWYPSTDKWITKTIAEEMSRMGGEEQYRLNLMDALANQNQPNTNTKTIDDFNGAFSKLKKEGIGNGGHWEPWNSKGTVGRDAIKQRLRNSLDCKRPFNNKTSKHGSTHYLPTLWVFNTCREVNASLKQWRLESWQSNRQLVTKDKKETPTQKFSHFCTAMEALFKDKRFRPRRTSRYGQSRQHSYFQGQG